MTIDNNDKILIKNKIREEGHCWSLIKNSKNASVNRKMYSAVEEANYKLNKYMLYDKLMELLE